MVMPVNRARQSMETGEQERPSVSLPLPLSDLLAFVNDCDVADGPERDTSQRLKPLKQRKRALPKSTDTASSESSNGKTKRVRRQIQELYGLREESEQLSHKLESMKQEVREREQSSIAADAQEDTKQQQAKAQSWANAAARQLLQRQASETEQAELQQSLQEQAQMADLVKQILAKSATEEVERVSICSAFLMA